MFYVVVAFALGAITILFLEYYGLTKFINSYPNTVPIYGKYNKSKISEGLLQNIKNLDKYSVLSINILVQFLFNELKDTDKIKRWIINKIFIELQELTTTSALGRILGEIRVKDINLGSYFPVIDNLQVENVILDSTESYIEELNLVMDVDYNENNTTQLLNAELLKPFLTDEIPLSGPAYDKLLLSQQTQKKKVDQKNVNGLQQTSTDHLYEETPASNSTETGLECFPDLYSSAGVSTSSSYGPQNNNKHHLLSSGLSKQQPNGVLTSQPKNDHLTGVAGTQTNVSKDSDKKLLETLKALNGFSMALDTDLTFVGKTALARVIINIVELRGPVRLKFSRIPYSHWSIMFIKEPEIKLHVDCILRNKRLPHVATIIATQIKRSIRKRHTFPHYKIRLKPFFQTQPNPDLLNTNVLLVSTADPNLLSDVPFFDLLDTPSPVVDTSSKSEVPPPTSNNSKVVLSTNTSSSQSTTIPAIIQQPQGKIGAIISTAVRKTKNIAARKRSSVNPSAGGGTTLTTDLINKNIVPPSLPSSSSSSSKANEQSHPTTLIDKISEENSCPSLFDCELDIDRKFIHQSKNISAIEKNKEVEFTLLGRLNISVIEISRIIPNLPSGSRIFLTINIADKSLKDLHHDAKIRYKKLHWHKLEKELIRTLGQTSGLVCKQELIPEKGERCIIVDNVLLNSPAQLCDLRKGDIIVTINGSVPQTLRQATKLINQFHCVAKGTSKLKIVIERYKSALSTANAYGIKKPGDLSVSSRIKGGVLPLNNKEDYQLEPSALREDKEMPPTNAIDIKIEPPSPVTLIHGQGIPPPPPPLPPTITVKTNPDDISGVEFSSSLLSSYDDEISLRSLPTAVAARQNQENGLHTGQQSNELDDKSITSSFLPFGGMEDIDSFYYPYDSNGLTLQRSFSDNDLTNGRRSSIGSTNSLRFHSPSHRNKFGTDSVSICPTADIFFDNNSEDSQLSSLMEREEEEAENSSCSFAAKGGMSGLLLRKRNTNNTDRRSDECKDGGGTLTISTTATTASKTPSPPYRSSAQRMLSKISSPKKHLFSVFDGGKSSPSLIPINTVRSDTNLSSMIAPPSRQLLPPPFPPHQQPPDDKYKLFNSSLNNDDVTIIPPPSPQLSLRGKGGGSRLHYVLQPNKSASPPFKSSDSTTFTHDKFVPLRQHKRVCSLPENMDFTATDKGTVKAGFVGIGKRPHIKIITGKPTTAAAVAKPNDKRLPSTEQSVLKGTLIYPSPMNDWRNLAAPPNNFAIKEILNRSDVSGVKTYPINYPPNDSSNDTVITTNPNIYSFYLWCPSEICARFSDVSCKASNTELDSRDKFVSYLNVCVWAEVPVITIPPYDNTINNTQQLQPAEGNIIIPDNISSSTADNNNKTSVAYSLNKNECKTNKKQLNLTNIAVQHNMPENVIKTSDFVSPTIPNSDKTKEYVIGEVSLPFDSLKFLSACTVDKRGKVHKRIPIEPPFDICSSTPGIFVKLNQRNKFYRLQYMDSRLLPPIYDYTKCYGDILLAFAFQPCISLSLHPSDDIYGLTTDSPTQHSNDNNLTNTPYTPVNVPVIKYSSFKKKKNDTAFDQIALEEMENDPSMGVLRKAFDMQLALYKFLDRNNYLNFPPNLPAPDSNQETRQTLQTVATFYSTLINSTGPTVSCPICYRGYFDGGSNVVRNEEGAKTNIRLDTGHAIQDDFEHVTSPFLPVEETIKGVHISQTQAVPNSEGVTPAGMAHLRPAGSTVSGLKHKATLGGKKLIRYGIDYINYKRGKAQYSIKSDNSTVLDHEDISTIETAEDAFTLSEEGTDSSLTKTTSPDNDLNRTITPLIMTTKEAQPNMPIIDMKFSNSKNILEDQVEKKDDILFQRIPTPYCGSENGLITNPHEESFKKASNILHHTFTLNQFPKGTLCQFCGKKIWFKAAFQCAHCHMICHKKCVDRCQIGTKCLYKKTNSNIQQQTKAFKLPERPPLPRLPQQSAVLNNDQQKQQHFNDIDDNKMYEKYSGATTTHNTSHPQDEENGMGCRRKKSLSSGDLQDLLFQNPLTGSNNNKPPNNPPNQVSKDSLGERSLSNDELNSRISSHPPFNGTSRSSKPHNGSYGSNINPTSTNYVDDTLTLKPSFQTNKKADIPYHEKHVNDAKALGRQMLLHLKPSERYERLKIMIEDVKNEMEDEAVTKTELLMKQHDCLEELSDICTLQADYKFDGNDNVTTTTSPNSLNSILPLTTSAYPRNKTKKFKNRIDISKHDDHDLGKKKGVLKHELENVKISLNTCEQRLESLSLIMTQYTSALETCTK